MSADATCGICGRTILAGERVHGFVDLDEEQSVCELCLARAERLGWRPVGEPKPEQSTDRHEGRWRLRRLRRPHRRPGSPAPAPAPKSEAAAPPVQRPRPTPTVDADEPSPFERAVARFNSSEGGGTVVGLTRTLGKPF